MLILLFWLLFAQSVAVHSTPVSRTMCAEICNKTGTCKMYNITGEELVQNIVDHSTVKFCSTYTHVLNQMVMEISNKTNVSLYGSPSGDTAIHCLGNDSGYQFTNVSNLTLSQIEFVGCGNSVLRLESAAIPIISGVWFYHCEKLTLTDITVRNSTGVGIALVNNFGCIEVNHSTFKNNDNNNIEDSSLTGGGVYIRFDSDKPTSIYGHEQRSCKLVFHDNTFTNNKAPVVNNDEPNRHKPGFLYESTEGSSEQLRRGGGLIFHFEDGDSWYAKKHVEVTDCLFTHNAAHYGGGMHMNFSGHTANNNVIIRNCTFTNNEADYGGGLSVTFVNNSHNNLVHLSDLYVAQNHAKKGGGGIVVGFHSKKMRTNVTNTLTVQNCRIVGNEAQYGGGMVYHCTKSKRQIPKRPQIKFIGCSWRENKAQFGAAVEASSHTSNLLTSGYAPSPSFKDCEFLSNFRLEEQYKSENCTRFSWGKGVFLATALRILFEGTTSFCFSNTSALWVSSSTIDFAAGSSVNFQNNTGYEGGAVYLIGLSELLVRDNSTFLFQNNSALAKGGAIRHKSTNKLDFVSSKRCFFRYAGNTTTIKERSITITFDNNWAYLYGNAIFATTLKPCWRSCKDHRDIDDTGCIGNVTFMHNDNRGREVATDGAVFDLSNSHTLLAIPGKEFPLQFKLLDDKEGEVDSSYYILVSRESTVRLDPTYAHIKGNTIKLFGQPGDKVNVTVGTKNFRDIAVRLEVEMEQCPPGFVTFRNHKKNGTECVCSAYTKNKTYVGIYQCALNNYTAYLIRGYWIGYDGDKESEETLRSGYCPRGFCVKKKSNDSQLELPTNRSQSILNTVICGKYRQGKLCGSCSENKSVFYHSNSYYCFENKYCELGILLYLLSETMPVTILFITVIVFNVKFTSGRMNGFILFVQFIDTMLIDGNGFISTNGVADAFISAYKFLYRMFNLNFFTLDELSYCLWKGANTLDILAFKYVTVVYAITLVILTVFLKKKVPCFKMRKSSTDSVKSTVIHGFSAFFVMCYSQCAKVTLFILTPGRVHSLGPPSHSNVTIVVFYKGDYRFLSRDHITYVVPAALFGIAIVLIPPLLLVIYPLCYKVLALLRIEETRFIQITCRVIPLENLKPLFDSFQSCFKDRYRFFAGLYFLYRLVALLSFLITDSLTKFYIALEVQLIVMLTLQAIVYPYFRRWHNIIDTLLFADLAVINAMTLHNYNRSQERYDVSSIDLVSAIQTILILIPFVIMLCFVITQLVQRNRRREREEIKDELTETLTLVDYRHLEDSRSL